MPKITVRDIDINYEIQGSGSPLLMIIGLKLSLLDWGNFTDLLAQHYQIIMLDNRDAGLTSQSKHPYTIADMADDAAGLLDALKIPKAHVFGVSMGGAIAQQFALQYPDKLDKLILGCTMAGGTCSQFGDISGVLNGNLLDLLFTPDYIESNLPALEVFFRRTTPFHSQDEALQRQLQAFATHDTCDTLSSIKAPTLILTGDKDIAIPPTNSDTLIGKIPNAKLEFIANAAHAFPFSHGDITANLLHTFLQQPSNMEKPTMPDENILKTFGAYAQAFNLLDPEKVKSFFHIPSMLMTSDQVAVMQSFDEVIKVFKILMDRLRKQDFAKSEIVGDLKVSQLSDNQGLVVGAAKRFDNKGKEIEYFGFTYTLRKGEESWKIIAGVIHEPEISG